VWLYPARHAKFVPLLLGNPVADVPYGWVADVREPLRRLAEI
jgi:hypothetical protein